MLKKNVLNESYHFQWRKDYQNVPLCSLAVYLVIFQYYYLDGMGADINAMMGGQGPTSDSGFFFGRHSKVQLEEHSFLNAKRR